MEIYVHVMMWGGLIEEVKAFVMKNAAERYRTAENAEFKELADFEEVRTLGVELG